MSFKKFPVLLALLITAVVATVLALPQTASLADDTHTLAQAAEKREAFFQRFLNDQHDPQALESLADEPCVNGSAGGYPCQNIDLLSFMPLNAIGGGSGNDIWGWTDPITGKEYAIMGRTSGTSFVDISDPINPIYLGNLPTQTASSIWRDIKTYADHAFIVSEAGGHGIQVFDLTRLRNVTSPPESFTNDAHYSGIGSAHNIVINEDTGFAYAVGASACAGGLHAVDISDPVNPTFAGCFDEDGYTHDAQCVVYDGPDTTHVGKEICVNANEDTVTIVDMDDKSTPKQLSRTTYSGSGYSHQGWLTEDHQYYLHDDELDEQRQGHNTKTYIFDVRDLDNPILIGEYFSPTPSIDHNQYILGNYAYQSNYRSGLRVLDITDIANANLTEAAFFDVYPANDADAFNGTWSNYPYYDSGIVVVSGIEQGLFILKPKSNFNTTVSPAAVEVCSTNPGMVTIDTDNVFGYSGMLNFTLGTLPAGVSGSFAQNPIMSGASNTLTLMATPTATSGTYQIDIDISDGTNAKSETVSMTIWQPAMAPGLVRPADNMMNASQRPRFEWTADATAAAYNIQIATDSGFDNIVVNDSVPAGTLEYRPTLALERLTTYYWRIRSENPCGFSAFSPVRTLSTKGESICLAQSTSLFKSDFEMSPNPAWSVGGIGATWGSTSADFFTGGRSQQASVAGSVTDQQLTSASITVPMDDSSVNLTFRHRYELDQLLGNCADGGLIEISSDGGSTWAQADAEIISGGYDLAITSQSNPLVGSPAYCGSSGWTPVVIDLADYRGQNIRLRFRLGSDSSGSSGNWAIDTVRVDGCNDSQFDLHLPLVDE